MEKIREHTNNELAKAEDLLAAGDLTASFQHLERAHVLSQARTYDHTRIHWRMLKLGLKMRSPCEIFGQIVRIVGAATKTPFGIYPTGNTGGANVWFFKRMPIPDDLQKILETANMK